MVDSQVEQGAGHGLLRDVFEVLEGEGKHVVIQTAEVAEVNQYLPWLQNFVHILKMVDARADPNQGVDWVFWNRVLANKIAFPQQQSECYVGSCFTHVMLQ